MKYVIIIGLLALAACGPTREQLASAKATKIIQVLQANGVVRQLDPQSLETLRAYLTGQLLTDVGDIK